jgi:hypothetical protein
MAGEAAAGGQGHTDTAGKDAAAAAAAAGDKGAADKGAAGDTGKAAAGAGEADKGSKAGESDDKPKAPDKYSLAIPDDAKEFIDDADLKTFETDARARDLTNDEAQAAIAATAKAQRDAHQKLLDVTKADPDYGGEKLADTQIAVKRAIDLVRPEGHTRRESFLRLLKKSGAGNHIEFVSFLADIGKRAAEDSPGSAQGGVNRGGSRPPEEVLYGKPKT